MPPARTSWILTFHGVGKKPRALDPGEERVWLDADRFSSVLDAVGSRPDVSLSFDDGNLSDVETALPLLIERGLTAMFFPCVGRLGEPGFLTPEQVRELVSAGMGIGSHGWAHRPWRGLPEEDLELELSGARKRLEDVVGTPVLTASCPFGAYDRRILGLLHSIGYERIYTSDGGPAQADDWLAPRTTVLRQHEAGDLVELLDRPVSLTARMARSTRLTLKRWR
jgi:peptidoglycan/xylan/chitin deacetylase (PgdA/CDA1 family)